MTIVVRATPGPGRSRVRAAAAVVGAAVVATVLAVLPSGATFADGGTARAGFVAVPAQPLLLSGGLDAGDDWSLGWDANGVLHAWGATGAGRLGTGSGGASVLRPTPVALPDGVRVVRAAAGIDLGIALAADGGVWTWGNPAIGTNTAVPQRHAFFDALDAEVVGVDAGGYYYLAWTADGALYSWGNPNSRLGRPAVSGRDAPGRVTAQGLDAQVVTSASAGRFHGAAVVGGEVVAWGEGHEGLEGRTLAGLTGGPVVGLVAGTGATLVWTADGVLHAATGSGVEVVPGVTGVVGATVSSPGSGEPGFWAWDDAGRLWAWGSNAGGQLGLGVTGGSYAQPQPVPLPPGGAVVVVAAGGTHALVDAGGGEFASAGFNASGQLGDGTTAPRDAFVVAVPALGWP